MGRLRETLNVYFAVRMRTATAADRLYIHRNTMQDRLRRIESELGYRPADRPVECQAALRLCEIVVGATGRPGEGRALE